MSRHMSTSRCMSIKFERCRHAAEHVYTCGRSLCYLDKCRRMSKFLGARRVPTCVSMFRLSSICVDIFRFMPMHPIGFRYYSTRLEMVGYVDVCPHMYTYVTMCCWRMSTDVNTCQIDHCAPAQRGARGGTSVPRIWRAIMNRRLNCLLLCIWPQGKR